MINFGTPERFQISMEWRPESEPVKRLPKHHGWSMGALAITVAGENLMAHRVGDHDQESLIWYLGPLFHWLAENWVALFHEERFPWPERSEDSAAVVCNQAFARFAQLEKVGAKPLQSVEAWYHRHGLASAATGGLFPDIFIRRFADGVELSWTAAPPAFAPMGFTFEIEPGLARLDIADVAEPLSNLLSWVRDSPPALVTEEFQTDWRDLKQKIDRLDDIAEGQFNAAAIAEALLARVRSSFHARQRDDLLHPVIAPNRRYVVAEAPAIAMFGGLSVDLSEADIVILRDALIASADGSAGEELEGREHHAPLRGKPWQDGYDLAADFIESFEANGGYIASQGFVDVRDLCVRLGIDVQQRKFDTDTIRGVALAGEGFSPSILLNTRSLNNTSEDGQRFTVGHELCHILHDQSRARRLAHASGPWAAPGVEKRANAFAAWLLMPPQLLQRYINQDAPMSASRLRSIASQLRVADTALVEHLYNLDLINEVEREELRAELRR